MQPNPGCWPANECEQWHNHFVRIYWYWPHPHRTANPLALTVCRPEDELVVAALRSLNGETFGHVDEYRVVRNLPDPSIGRSTYLTRLVGTPVLALRRSRARRAVMAEGFDVAHIEMLSPWTDWLDLSLLPRKTAFVSVVHDVRPHHAPKPGRVQKAALRATYARAGELVVFHQLLKDELISDFGVGPDRVHTLPIPVTPQAPRSTPEPFAAAGDRPYVALLFGSLRRNKGIEILIELLNSRDPALDAVQFIVAGAGDRKIEGELREIAERVDNLHVEIGFVTAQRRAELLRRADVLLLPYTTFHSQSGVLADAYSYRLPVIASDIGALGATVRADGTGIVIRPGSPAELGSAIVALLAEPSGRWAAAVDRAAAEHDVSVVGPQLRAVYEIAHNR